MAVSLNSEDHGTATPIFGVGIKSFSVGDMLAGHLSPGWTDASLTGTIDDSCLISHRRAVAVGACLRRMRESMGEHGFKPWSRIRILRIYMTASSANRVCGRLHNYSLEWEKNEGAGC